MESQSQMVIDFKKQKQIENKNEKQNVNVICYLLFVVWIGMTMDCWLDIELIEVIIILYKVLFLFL